MLDQNGMSIQPIHKFAQNCDLQGLRELLEANPQLIHANGWFGMKPLHYAAQGGSAECVEFLIKKGADVNAKCVVNKSTAVFEASTAEIAKLLVENGAILDLVTTKGRVPLDYAIQCSHTDVVSYLISQGVDVNYLPKLDYHHTMTQWCQAEITAKSNQDKKDRAYKILKILLEAGADPNIQDVTDSTVLHKVSRKGLVNFVNLLLQYDADPCIRNVSKQTCFDCAESFPEILELFEPYRQNIEQLIEIQDTPEQLIERIIKVGYLRSQFKPCSAEEIADLERRNRVKLPESYKKFLRIMGKGAGGFLTNDHWEVFYDDFFDNWLGIDYFKISEAEYPEYTQEEIELSLNAPKNFFVFATRLSDNPLGFFVDSVDEDPDIYMADDYGTEIKFHGSTFWKYIQSMVEYYEYFRNPNRFSRNKPK